MLARDVLTAGPLDVVDVTPHVADAFASAGTGLGHVFLPHTTAALIITESDVPDLDEDLKTVAEQWLAGVGPFRHVKNDNPNTVAHVLSAFAGTHAVVPVSSGSLDLGTYQHVLLVELDGPNRRTLRFAFVPTEPLLDGGRR